MKLLRREKILLTMTVGLLSLFVLHGMLVKPARQRLDTLQRVAPVKQAALTQMQDLAVQVAALDQRLQRFEQISLAEKSGRPEARLEELLERHGLNADQIDPQTLPLTPELDEQIVRIKLQPSRLQPVMAFIGQVRGDREFPWRITHFEFALSDTPGAPYRFTIHLALLRPASG